VAVDDAGEPLDLERPRRHVGSAQSRTARRGTDHLGELGRHAVNEIVGEMRLVGGHSREVEDDHMSAPRGLERALSRAARAGAARPFRRHGPTRGRERRGAAGERDDQEKQELSHDLPAVSPSDSLRTKINTAVGTATLKKVTQGSLDRKDGEAFLLFDAILSAFEKAHDIDPAIPRLVPISMRRHFGKHARKAPAAPSAPPVA
jgi:hypothetical protein